MDTTQATIHYLQKNRLRKPVIVVVDGNGEDPMLAEEAARIRRVFCHAKIPAYSSMPNAAKALAHLVNYQGNTLK
jgi:acyl-CoA synthetase (NDP forming)